ncbi:MAG: AsmA-like C-terminal region-containing protein, partial [Gemmataceae bacterium]
VNGRFSMELPYRHAEATYFPIGNGTFRIVNLRWNDEILSDSLLGNIRLTPDVVQIVNVNGTLAGGQLRGGIRYGLKTGSRGVYDLELRQVEASRLLLPLTSEAKHIKGAVDVNVHGGIARDWDGSGGVTLVRGQIFGMDITEWRLPVTFSFAPAQGSGELTVRDSHARIAQGRARFDSTLYWGNGLRLAATLLFYQVDLRTLFRNSPEVAAYVSGRVSGRIDMASSEMRSVNDLTAVVRAKMQQGQAMQLPVLRHIAPYLRPGTSSATFDSGELKGRLAHGIFRIERATLAGEFIKLLILGTINVAGNLNLEVTAQTGLNALSSANANNISTRIPLLGAIPRLILYEANSLLSLAVVHLRVTGTFHSPVVRLEPLLVMTEDAIRFFFNRAIGLDIPNLP